MTPKVGGRRDGSGRKKGKHWDGTGEYRRKTYRQFGLEPDVFEALKEHSRKQKLSQAQIVNDALKEHLQPEPSMFHRDTLGLICEIFDCGVIWEQYWDKKLELFAGVCFIGSDGNPAIDIQPFVLTPGFESENDLRMYVESRNGQREISKRAGEIFGDEWDTENYEWQKGNQ